MSPNPCPSNGHNHNSLISLAYFQPLGYSFHFISSRRLPPTAYSSNSDTCLWLPVPQRGFLLQHLVNLLRSKSYQLSFLHFIIYFVRMDGSPTSIVEEQMEERAPTGQVASCELRLCINCWGWVRRETPGAEIQGERLPLPRFFSTGLHQVLLEKMKEQGGRLGEASFEGPCLEENGPQHKKDTKPSPDLFPLRSKVSSFWEKGSKLCHPQSTRETHCTREESTYGFEERSFIPGRWGKKPSESRCEELSSCWGGAGPLRNPNPDSHRCRAHLILKQQRTPSSDPHYQACKTD